MQIQFAQDRAGLAGAVPRARPGRAPCSVQRIAGRGRTRLGGGWPARPGGCPAAPGCPGPRPGRNLVIDAAGGEVREDGEGFPAAGGNAGQHRQAVVAPRPRAVRLFRSIANTITSMPGSASSKVQRRAKPVLERHAADRSHAAIHRVGRLDGVQGVRRPP